AEDGIRDFHVTGVQTCALPISSVPRSGTRPGRVGTGSRRTPATTSRPAVTEEPGLAGSSRRAVSGFAPGPVVGRWSERADTPLKIGRASCRERVYSSEAGVALR